MTTESSGSRTKNDLDRALRQLLENRPLDQLRIRELTALCGIRRQSFYYHFPDVYALFDWSLEQEKRHLAVRQGQCLTWQQAMRDLLGHVDRHRRYYQVLLESQGRMGLRRVLGEALSGMLAQADGYYRLRCGVSRTAESAGLLSGWGDAAAGSGGELDSRGPLRISGDADRPAGDPGPPGGGSGGLAVCGGAGVLAMCPRGAAGIHKLQVKRGTLEMAQGF